MKPLVVPAKENKWLYVWWLPMLVFALPASFRHLPIAVYDAIDIILAVAFLWMLWRMWQPSSITLADTGVVIRRGRKLTHDSALTDVTRVAVRRAAVAVYTPNRAKPLVTHRLRVRVPADRVRYASEIEHWRKAKKVAWQHE